MLRTAGAGTAKLILVCIDDPKAVNHAVKLIKSEFPWSLVVRAYDRIHALALVKEGVDFQVRETPSRPWPSVKPPCARPGCRRTRPRKRWPTCVGATPSASSWKWPAACSPAVPCCTAT